MPSRARAGTAHEARLAFRAGPARQTGPRAVLVHRAGHVGRPGPARLVIRANRAGPDRARAGSGRARPTKPDPHLGAGRKSSQTENNLLLYI